MASSGARVLGTLRAAKHTHHSGAPTGSRGRAAWSYLLAGAVALALVVVVPSARPFLVPLGCVTAVSVVPAVALGLLWHRPSQLGGWALVGVSTCLLAVARVLAVARPHLVPVAVLAVLELLATTALVVVPVRLVRPAGSRLDLDVLLDGVLAGVGEFLLVWALVVAPRTSAAGVPTALRECAHLALALVASSVTTRLLAGLGARRSFALTTLALSSAVLVVATAVAWLLPTPSLLAPLLGLGSLLVGACFLHPSVARVGVLRPRRVLHRSSLTFALSTVVLPGLLAMLGLPGPVTARVTTGAAMVLLTTLAVLRVLRANEHHGRERAVLAHQATHDHLTGLANRAAMTTFLSAAVEEPGPVGVLFLDLDRFKYVNDTLGHAVGDELVVAVAERLEEVTPAGALVSRLGGDEFVVVLPACATDEAVAVAEAIRLEMREPFFVGGAEVAVAGTVGVAMRGPELSTVALLLRAADVALYEAKDAGRDLVRLYDASIQSQVDRRLAVETALRTALLEEEFSLVFQPVVGAHGRVTTVEALARWTSPSLGVVHPSEFVPVAEECGVSTELGAWALSTACAAAARWRDLGHPVAVAVNVSTRQVAQPTFVAGVTALLAEHRLPGWALELELTEAALDAGSAPLVEVLEQLRALGVAVAVDDFGTGRSSLALLQQLPVGRVKVDGRFVTGVADPSGSDRALVAAIVAMAAALGVETVAEGVETSEQEQALREIGCHQAQGYLYAPPCDASSLEELLARRGVATAPAVRATPAA